ncbi:MAG: hypothetical protein RBT75_19360 [Anaerolineae bacterium]|jgi:hypothetical protein|nr:hypothetical protein [Anaerolineae bacterium]
MSAEFLSSIAGAILSLLFSYLPGLSGWYDQFDANRKRLVMAALVILVAAGAYGLACSGFGVDFGMALTCDRAGLITLIQAVIAALIANQATYALSPQPARG